MVSMKYCTTFHENVESIYLATLHAKAKFRLSVGLDEAANAENLLPNSHAIKQLKYNLKPSIRGII